MSITSRALLAAALLLGIPSSLEADGINGLSAPTMGQDGITNKIAASAPPSSCDGTIDLSTGCAQPMLGGM